MRGSYEATLRPDYGVGPDRLASGRSPERPPADGSGGHSVGLGQQRVPQIVRMDVESRLADMRGLDRAVTDRGEAVDHRGAEHQADAGNDVVQAGRSRISLESGAIDAQVASQK